MDLVHPPPINGTSGIWLRWLVALVLTVLIAVSFILGSAVTGQGKSIAVLTEKVQSLERDFYSRPR